MCRKKLDLLIKKKNIGVVPNVPWIKILFPTVSYRASCYRILLTRQKIDFSICFYRFVTVVQFIFSSHVTK